MFRVLVIVAMPAYGIIVKDPLPSSDEYRYSYEIEDASTGDSKRQLEQRRGDVVYGAYSVLEPDGGRRTVHYTADPRYGFKAVVTKDAPTLDIDIPKYLPQSSRPTQLPITQDGAINRQYSSLPDFQDHYIYNNDDGINTAALSTKYFTPANKIKFGTSYFALGHYFKPNNEEIPIY